MDANFISDSLILIQSLSYNLESISETDQTLRMFLEARPHISSTFIHNNIIFGQPRIESLTNSLLINKFRLDFQAYLDLIQTAAAQALALKAIITNSNIHKQLFIAVTDPQHYNLLEEFHYIYDRLIYLKQNFINDANDFYASGADFMTKFTIYNTLVDPIPILDRTSSASEFTYTDLASITRMRARANRLFRETGRQMSPSEFSDSSSIGNMSNAGDMDTVARTSGSVIYELARHAFTS